MKKRTNIILLIFFASIFFACDGNKSDANNNKAVDNENIQTEEKDIENNEPVIIIVEDIKSGDIINGLTVSKFDYKGNTDFSLELNGEYEMTGNLEMSQVDGEINFTPDEKNRKSWILKMNDIEKPFFMWTTFSNEKEVLVALSPEQKKKYEAWEQIPVTITMKNYKIFASEYYISGSADFVKFK